MGDWDRVFDETYLQTYLPSGSLYFEERMPDWSTGTIDTYRVIISPGDERVERPYVLHMYS